MNKNYDKKYYKDLKDETDTIISLYEKEKKSTVEIAKMYETDKGVIKYLLNKNGVELRKYCNSGINYHFNETYFDAIDAPNKAYILGLLFADGNNSLKYNRIKLSLWDEDRQILEDIREEMEIEKPLFLAKNRHKKPKYHDAYELVIYSKHMSEKLNEKGMVPKKSLILDWPLGVSDELMSHFIRGYFDGDGYISKGVGCVVSFVSSTIFCQKLQEYLKNKIGVQNGHLRISKDNPKTSWLVYSQKKECEIICNYMYKNAELFMNRKYEIYKEKFLK